MKAIGKYVVIEPIKEVDVQTKGGLILAENQREDIRYRRAKVIEPGTEVEVLKKGDEGKGLDVVTGNTVDMVKAGIIDPLLVTKSALTNAASVATTILSTDCVINNVRA